MQVQDCILKQQKYAGTGSILPISRSGYWQIYQEIDAYVASVCSTRYWPEGQYANQW